MRHPFIPAFAVLLLSACIAEKRAPTPEQPPRPVAPVPALPAAPVGEDWRDVPLTPGTWFYRIDGAAGSVAQFGPPGGIALFALRCDRAGRRIVFSRGGGAPPPAPQSIGFLTSFAGFAIPAARAAGQPPAVTATLPAAAADLDKLAFSRGRFVVTLAGAPRLVIPAWPEVGRVIEDCR